MSGMAIVQGSGENVWIDKIFLARAQKIQRSFICINCKMHFFPTEPLGIILFGQLSKMS